MTDPISVSMNGHCLSVGIRIISIYLWVNNDYEDCFFFYPQKTFTTDDASMTVTISWMTYNSYGDTFSEGMIDQMMGLFMVEYIVFV